MARLETAQGRAGGVVIRTTPGQPESVDIIFLDDQGADLSQAAQRKLERVFARGEFRRAFPGEIGDLSFPPRVMEAYALELLRRVDTTGVAEAGLKVVVDTGGGTAALVLPSLLGRLGVDALTVNNGFDETVADRDGRGAPGGPATGSAGWSRRPGPPSACTSTRSASASPSWTSAACPSTTSGRCSSSSTWSPPSARPARSRCRSRRPGWPSRSRRSTAWRSGGSRRPRPHSPNRGPEASSSAVTAGAASSSRSSAPRSTASLRSSSWSAWSPAPSCSCPRSTPASRSPTSSRRAVPTPWAAKGMVMRAVVEAAGDRTVDTTDGVRVVEADGCWALVLPDPSEPVTHVWAEAADDAAAADLLERWAAVVERARPLTGAAAPSRSATMAHAGTSTAPRPRRAPMRRWRC